MSLPSMVNFFAMMSASALLSSPHTQGGKESEGKLWRFYLGAALSDVHRPITARLTNEMGVRYFQHMPMSWSTRRRGSVQRIHIMTKTRKSVLVRNQKGPAIKSGTKRIGSGPENPPRNSTTTSAQIG